MLNRISKSSTVPSVRHFAAAANNNATSHSGKDIAFGLETRKHMLNGAIKMSDIVGVTLGPKGRNVILSNPYGLPKITKDGVTVAKSVTLNDPLENLGATLIKEVAMKSNDEAGDGTTTSIIIATALYQEGCKHVNNGNNPISVLRGMDKAVKAVIAHIRSKARMIQSDADVLNIALISSNSDEAIGTIVADAMRLVGRDGCVNLVDGKSVNHELEVVNGFRLERGFLSPYFITDQKSQVCELNKPLVLVIDEKVTSMQNYVQILESVLQSQRDLLIIAEDVEGEGLATLILNKMRAGLKVCAIKAPGFGSHRSNVLGDLAAVTGAKVISNDIAGDVSSLSTEELMSYLGEIKSATVGRDETVLFGGLDAKSSKVVESRIDNLRFMINATKSDYEKEKLEERLATLTGGVAQIQVGGSSELEVAESKERFEDALCATRAAVREGIVPGGGTAILYAARDALKDMRGDNDDEQQGIEIVKKACRIPLSRIVQNSGNESALIVENLMTTGKWGEGYNASRGCYADLIQSGIVDPAKVVISSLKNAASVAQMLVTAEGSIIQSQAPSPMEEY